MADREFMQRALEQAKYAKDNHGKVGAVIVADGEIISSAGSSSDSHAEHAALSHLGWVDNPPTEAKATMYVTVQPCQRRSKPNNRTCTSLLESSGIVGVVYAAADPQFSQQEGERALRKRGIQVTQIPDQDLRERALQYFRQDLDVVCIGSMGIDHINGQIHPGGAVMNTAFALQLLGARTGVVTTAGQGEDSKQYVDALTEAGIDVSCIEYEPNYTLPQAYIQIRDHDCRMEKVEGKFTFPTTITEKTVQYLVRSPSLFLRSTNALAYIKIANCRGMDVYVTLHHTTNFFPEILEFGECIKAIFGNEEEELLITPHLPSLKDIPVFITLGKAGSKVHLQGLTKVYPATNVNEIDPTGAGDAFAAGAVYSLLKGEGDPSVSGNRMGGLAVAHYGARVRHIEKTLS